MAFSMDIILLSVMIVGFIGNILITRFLLKRISDKIIFSQPHVSAQTITGATTSTEESGKMNPMQFMRAMDKPMKNDVMDQDLNDVEFSEQVFDSFPKELKVEVEGGDTQSPPGFEGAEKK